MNDKHPKPSEADQQWLKDLFDSAASDTPQQTPPGSGQAGDDEQWLQELFASAEQAADMAFAAEEPEEEPPLVEDFHLPDDLEAQSGEAAPAAAPAQKAPEAPAPQKKTAPKPKSAASGRAKPAPKPAEEPEQSKKEEKEKKEPQEKRRPKNKNTYGLFGIPHMLVTVVWIAIVLTIGVFLGQWLWQGASDVLAFGREDKLVTIYIDESDDLDTLTNKLHDAGLIQEPMWFRLYAKVTDAMEDIGHGTFELNTLFDYRALVSHMSPNSSARVTVKVRIPEGKTCAEVFALLEEKGVCSVEDLEAAATGGSIKTFWFLEGVSRDHKYCLEGYLFPDTYEFYLGDDAARVLNTMLTNFDTRFTDIMLAKLEVLNETLAEMMRKNGLSDDYIQSHAFTLREVVIIASMIEKETAGAAESYNISSVIYNRLTNPTNFPYLNIDAALVYITGNPDLTEADKAIDSPYNTYLYPGLIPGPICNPSRASLDAALDPAATGYYFYAYDPATASHHFSATYAEHQQFLESLSKEETQSP